MPKLTRSGKILKYTDSSINRVIFDYGIESTITTTKATIAKGTDVIYNGLLSNLLDKDDIPYTNDGLAIFLGILNIDNTSSVYIETALATIQNPAATEFDKYVSARRFWNGITTFLGLSNIWTALQTFTSIATKQIYTTKQTFMLVGASPSQVINLDNGSYISLNLTSASGTLTLSLTNGKIGASYWIQVVQATTAVNISLVNEGRFDGETGSTIVGINSSNYCIIPLFTGTGYLLNIATLT